MESSEASTTSPSEDDDGPVKLSVKDIKSQVLHGPLEDEGYSGDSEEDDLDDFIEKDDEGIVIYELGHDYYLSPQQRTSYGNDSGLGFCICAICKAYTSKKQVQEDPGLALIQCRAKNDMTKNRRIGCLYKFHLKCLDIVGPPRGEWICACCMAKHMSIFGPKETTQVTTKGYVFSPNFPAEESDEEEKEWREVFVGKRDAVTKKKLPTKKLRKKKRKKNPFVEDDVEVDNDLEDTDSDESIPDKPWQKKKTRIQRKKALDDPPKKKQATWSDHESDEDGYTLRKNKDNSKPAAKPSKKKKNKKDDKKKEKKELEAAAIKRQKQEEERIARLAARNDPTRKSATAKTATTTKATIPKRRSTRIADISKKNGSTSKKTGTGPGGKRKVDTDPTFQPAGKKHKKNNTKANLKDDNDSDYSPDNRGTNGTKKQVDWEQYREHLSAGNEDDTLYQINQVQLETIPHDMKGTVAEVNHEKTKRGKRCEGGEPGDGAAQVNVDVYNKLTRMQKDMESLHIMSTAPIRRDDTDDNDYSLAELNRQGNFPCTVNGLFRFGEQAPNVAGSTGAQFHDVTTLDMCCYSTWGVHYVSDAINAGGIRLRLWNSHKQYIEHACRVPSQIKGRMTEEQKAKEKPRGRKKKAAPAPPQQVSASAATTTAMATTANGGAASDTAGLDLLFAVATGSNDSGGQKTG